MFHFIVPEDLCAIETTTSNLVTEMVAPDESCSRLDGPISLQNVKAKQHFVIVFPCDKDKPRFFAVTWQLESMCCFFFYVYPRLEVENIKFGGGTARAVSNVS